MWQEVMKSKCGYCGFSGYQGFVSFPKFSRQFFDYIPTLVDICPRDVDIFLS